MKKIKNFHHHNAYEYIMDHATIFVSYYTPQAIQMNNNIYQCTAKYSSTTSKQLNRWVRETPHQELFKISTKEFYQMLMGSGYGGAIGHLRYELTREK